MRGKKTKELKAKDLAKDDLKDVSISKQDKSSFSNFESILRLKNFRANTIYSYKKTLEIYLKFCKKYGHNPDSEVSVNEFNKYLAMKVSARSRARHLSALKFYFDRVLNIDIRNKIDTPKYEEVLPIYLTENELKLLIGIITDLKDRAMFILGYEGALRVSELININRSDVEFRDNDIKIKVMRKGGKERYIVITSKVCYDTLREYLTQRTDGDERLFPISPDAVEKKFAKYLAKAKIVKKSLSRKRGFHILRHSKATHLIKAGWSLRHVQEFLGHKRVSTTAIYTHIEPEELERKVRETKSVLDI